MAEGKRVDLELVLAVDASYSIDNREFRLQMQGIAAAFRAPEIVAAIGSGPIGAIAVSLVVWAEATRPQDVGPWMELRDASDAEAFARLVEDYPRRVSGGTGIGKGIAVAARHIADNGFEGTRKVIDVSGDGKETPAREWVVLLPQARAMADRLDITVNGLAILNEESRLDLWYRDHVITGFGAFVMRAGTLRHFAAAIRRKLAREIRHDPNVAALTAGD
ncbi:DUF1194 domain-containing protein [Marivibrio halodurans]|uniref:DUF1194 domain-containing protein n=1 Tax=Marivibrio halodurans TaxID=2039722 RepID=A0A8J7S111_9PROT|nr:DUF1194 domain-containing protein [Marivibrio halodurans]MBP5858275.1 DUF1194 domain-containing protein [Marivibrio halodurans]